MDNGKAVERIDLSRPPSIEGLPIITKALVQMHRDTQAQRRTLEQARATPGLVEQVATPDMVTAYCAQRADLRGYHRMLTAWREEASLPEMKVGIDRFLQAVNEIGGGQQGRAGDPGCGTRRRLSRVSRPTRGPALIPLAHSRSLVTLRPLRI